MLTFLISISLCRAQNTDDLIPVCLDGKWGYIDTNGVMVIEPQFDESSMEETPIMRHEEASNDSSKFVVSIIENGKYGFADRKTGKIVIKPQFDEVGLFYNGFSIVKINTQDTIKREYDLANDDLMPIGETPIGYYVSAEGHSIYVYNGGFYGKYGYVSDKGKIVIKPQFDKANLFNSNGFAEVKQNGKCGVINTKGKFVLAPKYDSFSASDNYELICVKQDGKSQLINLKGDIIADLELEPKDIKEVIETALALMVRDNHLPIPIKKADNKFDFIDINGKTVFRGEFDDVWIFYKGTTKFMKNGKWGLIDSTGKIITEPRFDELKSMIVGDFYISKLDGKYGVVDLKGNVVLEPQFIKIVEYMEEGKYIKAIGNDGFGLYDTTGKMIIEPKFYNIKVKDNRIFVSYKDSYFHWLVGMYNFKGECIVEPKFDAVYSKSFLDLTFLGF